MMIEEVTKLATSMQQVAAKSEIKVNFEMISPQIVLLWDFSSKGIYPKELSLADNIKTQKLSCSILET